MSDYASARVRASSSAGVGPDASGQVTRVILRAGETLEQVAAKTGFSIGEILKANPQIKSASALRPGVVLNLPRPIAEPVVDRARRESPLARADHDRRTPTATIGPQVGRPLRQNPYDDFVATKNAVTSSLSAAVAATVSARRGGTIAEQRRAAELAQTTEVIVSVLLAGRAAAVQRYRARAKLAEWEGKPLRAYRQDHDFRRGVISGTNKAYKSHIDKQGNLRPANPSGKTTAWQHVDAGVKRSDSPAVDARLRAIAREHKSDSPYTSATVAPGRGVNYGGKTIVIDLERVRRDIASGKLRGVEIVERRQLQRQLIGHIRATEAANRDHEILIKGTLPKEYFRPTAQPPSEGIRSTRLERHIQDRPAIVEKYRK